MTGTAGLQTVDAVQKDPLALARQGADTDILAAIDRRETLLGKLRDAGLRATRGEQWTDMDGKPWPTASAAEVIARRCAVSIHSTTYRKERSSDEKGEFYFYVYTGTFELPTGLDRTEVMGTCSSRDQFIGTETSKGRPLGEINEDDIMKAAYSNMVVNGVMRLLGLRGLTWEVLAAYGVEQGKASKVEHATGARGGGTSRSTSDVAIKFGNGKGKNLSELSDKDIAWYVAAWERDLADQEKSKFHDNCRKSLEIAKVIMAERANKAAGTTPPADAAAKGPSVWDRIRALDKSLDHEGLIEIVRVSTKKAKASELEESDIAIVQKALADRKAGKDIPF